MNEAQRSISIFRPDVLLRMEALLSLTAVCIAYQRLYPGRWGLFALLFLAPDLSLLAYLGSRGRLASVIYNSAHNFALPLALGLAAFGSGWQPAGKVALIWLAHIAFDRVLGYGLKFPTEFKFTHIQACAVSPVK